MPRLCCGYSGDRFLFLHACILPFLLPLLVAAFIAVSGCRFERPNPG
jgi:hypothetical protein